MLSTALAAKLRQQYPGASVSGGVESEPLAIIPARHPAVGDVVVWAENSEVRIEVGVHTHGHFTTYDDPSPESAEASTIASVLEFLEALFADQVVVWSAGESGGWYRLNSPAVAKASVSRGAKRFLWSGPLSS